MTFTSVLLAHTSTSGRGGSKYPLQVMLGNPASRQLTVCVSLGKWRNFSVSVTLAIKEKVSLDEPSYPWDVFQTPGMFSDSGL